MNKLHKLHKFHTIDNPKDSLINKIKYQPCYKEEWVVMEKVHGCNFSFTCNGYSVKMGKRTSFLTEEEYTTFYNVGEHMNRYISTVKKIYDYLNLNKNNNEILTIYGELFGGYYPKHPSLKKVQKGVHYCPNYEFYAFDVRVGDNYLNYDLCESLFRAHGMFYAQVLFRGNFDDCYKWSQDNKDKSTTIPILFGLPEVKYLDRINSREGHVLKPVQP